MEWLTARWLLVLMVVLAGLVGGGLLVSFALRALLDAPWTYRAVTSLQHVYKWMAYVLAAYVILNLIKGFWSSGWLH